MIQQSPSVDLSWAVTFFHTSASINFKIGWVLYKIWKKKINKIKLWCIWRPTNFVIIIDHYFLPSKFQTWKFSTTTSCHHNLNWNFWIILVKGLLLYIWIVKRLLEIMVHKFVHMCNFPTWPRGPSGSVGKVLSSWSKGCTFDPGLMREVVFSCNL